MLPKKSRIQKKDFPSGTRQGFRVFSPLFSATVYQSTNGTRVSVVVSKKTAKTAVARNTMRRRMYAAITPFLRDFPRGFFVVLYPKAEVKQAPFSVLQKEIEVTLRKLVK